AAQLEIAASSWRIRGSGRMSTAAKRAPIDCRIATVRAEKPHAGASGVPFINRITGFSPIASWIASRIGFEGWSLIGPPLELAKEYGSGSKARGYGRRPR